MYAGGDKEFKLLKDLASAGIMAYKAALDDLVKAISIAHALGKTLDDYWAQVVSIAEFCEVSTMPDNWIKSVVESKKYNWIQHEVWRNIGSSDMIYISN